MLPDDGILAFDHAIHADRPGMALRRVDPGLRGQPRAPDRVEHETFERIGQRPGVAGRHDEAAAPRVHHLRQAAGIRYHHRDPAGHRLRHGHAEAFGTAGRRVDVQLVQPGWHLGVRHGTDPAHPAAQTESLGLRLQGGALGPIAHDQQAAVGTRRADAQTRESLQQQIDAAIWSSTGPVTKMMRSLSRLEGRS